LYLSLPALFKAGYFKCNDASTPQTKSAIGNSSSLSPSITPVPPRRGGRVRNAAKRTPPRDRYQGDSDDSLVINDLSRAKKRKAKARSRPAGKARGYKSPKKKTRRIILKNDSDSDSPWADESPARKHATKGSPDKCQSRTNSTPIRKESPNKGRKKRIPYSEIEKSSLLKGVNRFGIGEWRVIQEYYSDVFKVNERSNINLKDLYRTLTKGKE